MSRSRGDPARVYVAARAGTLNRLTTVDRLSDRAAEALLSSWELHAELSGIDRGSSHYWYEADRWIRSAIDRGGTDA